MKEEKYQVLFLHAREIFWKSGYEFLVVTEGEIRRQPLLDNVKLLHKYLAYADFLLRPDRGPKILCRNDSSTLSEITEHFASKGKRKQVIYAMIYAGIISTDMDTESLGPNMKVRPSLKVLTKAKKTA